MSSSVEILSLDAFVGHICERLDLDAAAVDPDAQLVAELDYDSLLMLELLLEMADLGYELPEDQDPRDLTLRLLHQEYALLVGTAPLDAGQEG